MGVKRPQEIDDGVGADIPPPGATNSCVRSEIAVLIDAVPGVSISVNSSSGEAGQVTSSHSISSASR